MIYSSFAYLDLFHNFVYGIQSDNDMSQISSNELSALAYKKVKSLIVNKKLIPGQKIVQDKLALELGISRTPLRAALQMLEAGNLVQSIPRRGMIVKEFTDQEIIEIFECRIALESTAVRLFTTNASDVDIKKIESLFAPFVDSDIDIAKYQKADSEFHNSILEKCGNGMLNQLFQKGNLLLCIDMIGLVRPPEETLTEHIDIINAIKKKDGDLAGSLLKNHLDISKQLFQKKMNG